LNLRTGLVVAMSILRRSAWLLLLAALVGGLAGYGSAVASQTYTASTQVVVLTSAASQTNPEELARQQTLARGYATLVRSDGVLSDASAQLSARSSLDDVRRVSWLRERVNASVGRDAFYLTIAASAADPALAADIVNATATAFVNRVQAVQTQIQEPALANHREAITSLTRQLEAVDAQIGAVQQTATVPVGDPVIALIASTTRQETLATLIGLRSSIQERLDTSNADLRTMLTRQKEGAVLWQAAFPPERPEGPGLLSSSLVGAALALLVTSVALLVGARRQSMGNLVGATKPVASLG
jgi:capsular polysaccharide biosynthesis protein